MFDHAETQRLGGDTCAAQRTYAAVLEIEPEYILAQEWIDTLERVEGASPMSSPERAAAAAARDHANGVPGD
eukprot:COSAG05_NODE_8739_length_676_cov_1.024263_1_plen_71_part_01